MTVFASRTLEDAPDPMLVVDRDGVIVDSNRALEQALGYKPNTLRGRVFLELVPERIAKRMGRDVLGALRARAQDGRHCVKNRSRLMCRRQLKPLRHYREAVRVRR